MLDKLFALLFPEPDGPYVSAAGFVWRFVDRRYRKRLNAMLGKGYRKPEGTHGDPTRQEEAGWPLNHLRLSTWLDDPLPKK